MWFHRAASLSCWSARIYFGFAGNLRGATEHCHAAHPRVGMAPPQARRGCSWQSSGKTLSQRLRSASQPGTAACLVNHQSHRCHFSTGTKATDPVTFLSMILLLLVVALLAGYSPGAKSLAHQPDDRTAQQLSQKAIWQRCQISCLFHEDAQGAQVINLSILPR